MNLKNEKVEQVYKYDLDLTSKEEATLAQMGLDLIAKDKSALINYAVVKILENHVKLLSDKRDGVEKLVKKIRKNKEIKNGTED